MGLSATLREFSRRTKILAEFTYAFFTYQTHQEASLSTNLSQQEIRRGRLHRWLQTAAFLGAAAILGMVIYTSFVVQSNRQVEEAAVTAAVRTQTAAVANSQPSGTASGTQPTASWEQYASTPLPASLQPIRVDSAAQVEEVARWGRGVLNGVVWSPDGRLLAVGTSLGVYLYEPRSLEAITLLDVGDSVGPMAFSPDGQFIALGLSKGQVQLWNIADSTLLQTVAGVDATHLDVGFTPAGQLLLTWMSPGDTSPMLWRDGMAIRLPRPEIVSEGGGGTTLDAADDRVVAASPAAMALSSDGNYVAAGLSDGKIHLWQIGDREYVKTIETGLLGWEQVLLSPNGRFLAVASAPAGVRVWQVSDGTLLYTLEDGLQGALLSLDFFPDARTLLVVDSQAIRFYGLDSGAFVRLIEIPSDAGNILLNAYIGSSPFGSRVAISPDGQRLALGPTVGPLLLFDVELGVLRRAQAAFTLPWCGLALSPNGETVAVRTFMDDVLSLWDVARAMPKNVLPAPAGCGLGTGTFSPDSQLLAVGSGEMVSLWQVDGTLFEQLGPYPEQMNPSAPPQDLVHCAVFSPDGRRVAAISNAGQLQLWQRPEGELVWTTTMTSTALSSLCSLAFSPGGQYLATSGLGSPISLWAIPEGTLVQRWDVSQDEAMGGLAFSPGGQLLAAWTAAQEVSLWPVTGGERLFTLTVPTEAGLGLTFSPDGSILAGSSVEGPIYLWSVSDGALLNVLEGHNTWVGGLAFSPDECLLFSASGDGTTRVWGVR